MLAGVREHVEAELERRCVERATAEDMAEILDRVGGPDGWGEPGVSAISERTGRTGVAEAGTVPRWPGFTALAFTLAGGALLLLRFWWAWALGWGLLLSGVVLTRLSLDDEDPEARSVLGNVRPGPTRRLLLLIWWLAAGEVARLFGG